MGTKSVIFKLGLDCQRTGVICIILNSVAQVTSTSKYTSTTVVLLIEMTAMVTIIYRSRAFWHAYFFPDYGASLVKNVEIEIFKIITHTHTYTLKHVCVVCVCMHVRVCESPSHDLFDRRI